MRQFAAIVKDAYRELNSKKLFWIILGLSGIVVLFYASIGFDEDGVFMFFGLKHIENEFMRAGSSGATILYRGIFSSLIVGFWLSWIAVILALVSTTTIFPDLVAGGSIDLVLSKPIGRVRLFLYKYLASLLFVLLQFGLFCIGIFLCVGWRLGEWNVYILAAIPLLVLFYSYLFSVNVLIGIVTRSAMTALLLTLLLWLGIFSISSTEVMLNVVKTQAQIDVDRWRDGLPEDAPLPPDVASSQNLISSLEPWHDLSRTIKFVLPKTSETVNLIDRWLRKDADVDLLDLMYGRVKRDGSGGFQRTGEDAELKKRLVSEEDNRSLTYIIGTSLIFEFLVLGLALIVFVRRDF